MVGGGGIQRASPLKAIKGASPHGQAQLPPFKAFGLPARGSDE